MQKQCFRIKGLLLGVALTGMLLSVTEALAKEEETLKEGIQIGLVEGQGDLDLSGMTAIEAENAITEYISGISKKEIALVYDGDNKVTVTPAGLGLTWKNTGIIEDALNIGTTGNVVVRYKMLKDLEQDKKVFVLEFDADREAILNLLNTECVIFDRQPVDFSLKKEKEDFSIIAGTEGSALNIPASSQLIYEYLTKESDFSKDYIQLAVEVLPPRGSVDELMKVKDVLGSFTTSFASSSGNRKGNIRVGSEKMSGVTLYPGDEFSAIDAGGPFGESNGYFEAGAFLNGRVVESFGGGICQVTTTLYNAVLRAELNVSMRYNHSMTVSYVEPGEDAAIATSAGKDFKFINSTDYPIYIDAYTTEDSKLVYTIYGVESRNPDRVIEYVSEILEETVPTTERIYADSKKPLGYIDIDPPHNGYRAKLWKVIKENGVETGRELINRSNYKATPKTATVGVVTEDANAYNELMVAIETSDIAHVQEVIHRLTSAPADTSKVPGPSQ